MAHREALALPSSVVSLDDGLYLPRVGPAAAGEAARLCFSVRPSSSVGRLTIPSSDMTPLDEPVFPDVSSSFFSSPCSFRSLSLLPFFDFICLAPPSSNRALFYNRLILARNAFYNPLIDGSLMDVFYGYRR